MFGDVRNGPNCRLSLGDKFRTKASVSYVLLGKSVNLSGLVCAILARHQFMTMVKTDDGGKQWKNHQVSPLQCTNQQVLANQQEDYDMKLHKY